MMIVPIMSLSHDVAFIFMIHIRRVQIDRKESNVVSCEFRRCVRVARKWPRSLFFFFFLNNQSYDKGTCRPTRGRFFVRPTSKRDPLGESECTPPSIRGRVVAWSRGRVVAWAAAWASPHRPRGGAASPGAARRDGGGYFRVV